MAERDYLQIARDAFSTSTSYVDANYRKKWEDAIRMHQSKHPSGSKYHTDAYQHRSKLFRPKTRSVVRKNEAAAAAAFFSNMDVVDVQAVNESDRNSVASASVMKEVLQYRLTKTIPWFQILIGGLQDAHVVGAVCSYQYWDYKAKTKATGKYSYTRDPETGEPVVNPETGEPMVEEVREKKVIRDQPCVELLPIENVRFDPAASWIDPVNSSPYFIRLIPMYVTDVKSNMTSEDDKTGRAKWKQLTDGEIRSAMGNYNDSTRQVRENGREDSKDSDKPLTEFEVVWVHENFVRLDDEDVVYYTLGTEHMLTEPVPIREVYFTGERPVVIGVCVIETHKVMPDAPVIMGESLQREANEIANQRLDNVKLVLNKRHIVKRGAQVDYKSLVRNVPGAITLANNVNEDIRTLEYNDVTGSSYAEQDRVNVDYDELLGNFSTGSVQTNRKLNETVGGMGIMSNSANQMTEYTIKTFTETWVERVLRQLVKLEQHYETDQVVLAVAAEKAQLWKKFGMDGITDEMMMKDLTLTVNVGMGATDPNSKMQKLIMAVKSVGETMALQIPDLDMNEISNEIFSLAGYSSARRFMKTPEQMRPDPRVMEMIQQAQEQLELAKQELDKQAADQQAKETDLSAREVEMDKARTVIRSERTDLLATKKVVESNISRLKAEIKLAALTGAMEEESEGETEEVA